MKCIFAAMLLLTMLLVLNHCKHSADISTAPQQGPKNWKVFYTNTSQLYTSQCRTLLTWDHKTLHESLKGSMMNQERIKGKNHFITSKLFLTNAPLCVSVILSSHSHATCAAATSNV